jgi:hypothetical protein
LFEVLGVDESEFDRVLGVGNVSLGAAQAALLRRIKPHLSDSLRDGGSRHRWVRQYFGHEVLVPQGGERFGLRPHDAAALRELSAAAAESIGRAGYPVTGDLADLVPAEEQPVRPHPDDVTEAEMLEVAARAIDQMIRDVRELSNRQRRGPGGKHPKRRKSVRQVARTMKKRLTP